MTDVTEGGRGWRFEGRSFGAATLVCLPFAALVAVLAILAPPSAPQQLVADPLVQLLGRGAAWVTVVSAALLALASGRRAQLRRTDVARAIAGAAMAGLVALALRAVLGAHLPSFIPPEESSAPGVTLGLTAGLLEEIAFRLIVLPGTYLACRHRLGMLPSAAAAVLVTSVLFSLSHELGPAGGAFEPRFMLTRLLLPGAAMSIVALGLGPVFIVSAHCTAHLLIPPLFHR